MNETIGARLREAREKRQLTLQQASEITKVRLHYLQALEDDDLSVMPSAAQGRGFLRIYADYLGLQLPDLLPSDSQSIQPPLTELPTAPKATAPESAKVATSSLVDTLRSLFVRPGKRAVIVAASRSENPVEPEDTGSAETAPSADASGADKKKVNR